VGGDDARDDATGRGPGYAQARLRRWPLGRNETGMWWRRHDEYDNQ
jgi:predicted dithiol-disulfide oxidoreductase (DUF899 family)